MQTIPVMLEKLGLWSRPILVRGWDKALRWIVGLGRKADKIILLWDLHSFSKEELQKRFENIQNQLPVDLRERVRYAIAKREIEAWFLADPDAVRRISGHEINVPDPEVLEEPAKELDHIFRQCGKEYVKASAIAVRLAREMDLTKAANNCPSLKEFLSLVKDCGTGFGT
jgi:hypothetical protein